MVRATCPRGDVLLQCGGKRHTALVLLSSCAKDGVPVVTSAAPWSEKLLAQRVKRGSHQSCKEHKPFLREEMLDFVNKGFFTLLPWRLVKDPPGLRVSPLGIIPQRERRPRLTVDHSFCGTNAETVQLAPSEAMQFGRTLERTLQKIRHADPHHGPVCLSKVDLADGFC